MAWSSRNAPVRRYSRGYRKYRRDARRFPSSTYSTVRALRGTEESLAAYGASRALANDTQLANRVRTGMTGRGAYWGQSLGSAAGRILGNAVGLGATGASIGSSLGDMGSNWLESKIFGKGDYMSGNALVAGGANGVPMFSSAADETGALTISHREYVQDISAYNSGFNVNSFNINPGLRASFPWLSQIACNYDEYEFEGLLFAFVSTSQSQSTSNNSMGTVIMATNYNPCQPTFASKVQMMEYDAAQSKRQDENQIHGIECDPTKRGGNSIEYVRTGGIGTYEDLKTYDAARFQLAVNGCNGSGLSGSVFPVQVGELWVTYKVTLRKPKLVSLQGGDGWRSTSASTATPFGGILTTNPNDTRSILGTMNSAGIYTFPLGFSGSVRATFICTGAFQLTSLMTEFTALNGCNISVLNDINETASYKFQCANLAGTVGNSIIDFTVVDIPNVQASMKFTGFAATSASYHAFNLVMLPNTGFRF